MTYDPNGAFAWVAPGDTGDDSFSYTVSDGNGAADTANVALTINGVNDAPVLTNIETYGLLPGHRSWDADSGTLTLTGNAAKHAPQFCGGQS